MGDTTSSREVIYDFGCGSYKSPSSIGIDRETNSAADIIADIEHLEGFVADGVADKVMMTHVLEHVNPLNVLRQAYRILKPGGTVRIEVPNAYNASLVLRLLFRNTYSVVPGHLQAFGFVELKNVVERAGFRKVTWGYKDSEPRFLDTGSVGLTNKLGRLVRKVFPQFSEVLWMEATKPEVA